MLLSNRFIFFIIFQVLILVSLIPSDAAIKETFKKLKARKTVQGLADYSRQVFRKNFKGDDTCVKEVNDILESLDKYIYLRKLQNTNEDKFYKCLILNVDKMLPIVYTPAVGKACKRYKKVMDETVEPRGLTLNIRDHKGKIEENLRKWPNKEVKAIVVTDGERILGLGDLGANGMGIPVGKMAIYTALGGIHPKYCLPVTLDVGTNNERYLGDRANMYVGIKQKRVVGEEYDAFIDEFVQAVVKVFGRYTLIQFEDFANQNAQRLLDKYRKDYTVFNDDIQGTAAVAVAGILAAARFSNTKIDDTRVLFVGAGSAALGIANLIVDAMEGNAEENRKKIYMKDKSQLLSTRFCPFNDEKKLYCHEIEGKDDTNLAEIIKWMKPTVLIGVAGAGRLFTKEVLEAMADVSEHPIIFPLSNPTDKSECTAEEAYKYTNGKCLFASGSPFAPVYVDWETIKDGNKGGKKEGHLEKPQQCNNDNVFPGVALGILVARMKTVPNKIFLIAAQTLAYKCTTEKDFKSGSLFPKLNHLRDCSIHVAAAIVEYAFDNDLATLSPRPKDIKDYVMKQQYRPKGL